MLCLAVAASATAGVASAKTAGMAWYATSASIAKSIQYKYDVTAARCVPLHFKADKQAYGAYSEKFNNGTVGWTAVLCALVLPDKTTCIAIAHITGQQWDAFHLGTFRYHGCTPFQIVRRPASGATA